MTTRIGYPHIVSTLALLVALSGSAYAVTQLPKNSVGPAQIKKNAVSAKKVKDGSLTRDDLAAGTIPPSFNGAAAGGGLTGTYPNPSVNVGALTGVVKGSRLTGALTQTAADADVYDTLLTVPGVGTLGVRCILFVGAGSPMALWTRFTNTSASEIHLMRELTVEGGTNIFDSATLASGATQQTNVASSTGPSARVLRLSTLTTPAVVITVFWRVKAPAFNQCLSRAEAIVGP